MNKNQIQKIGNKIEWKVKHIKDYKTIYYKFYEENNILRYFVLFEGKKEVELDKDRFNKVIDLTSGLVRVNENKYNCDIDIVPINLKIHRIYHDCKELK